MRFSRLIALTAFLLLPQQTFAADLPAECAKGRYVVTINPGLKGSNELNLVEDVGNVDLKQRSAHFATVVDEGMSSSANPETVKGFDRLCQSLKRHTRGLIRNAREEGKFAIARRISCSCDAKFEISQLPNDPYMPNLWGLNNGNNIDMDMPDAWDISTGVLPVSNPPVVAVIDTGVDYNHEDLRDNMWINPGEIAGNGIDDDQNGFIDDVHGINATVLGQNPTGNPMDDNSHGTHCAGTIAGKGNNAKGVAGVSWHGKIMALKFMNSTGKGYLSHAVAVIDYMILMKNRGVNIVVSNNSWGSSGFVQTLYDAVVRANNAGILFVAAAGNETLNVDTTLSSPGGFTDPGNLVSVAALDSNGNLASFSNYGAQRVHIGAPGVSIASSVPGNIYKYFNGTSMAAPHVSGALYLLSIYAPHLTMAQKKSLLFSTGKSVGSLAGRTITGKMPSVSSLLAQVNVVYPPGPTPTPTITPTATVTSTPTIAPTATRTATPTATPEPGHYNVSGTVTQGSQRLSSVKLTLQIAGRSDLTVFSDENGDYIIPSVLGPINYTLIASLGGYTFTPYMSYLSHHTLVNFNANSKQYALSGQVIDDAKQPIAGASVNAGALGVFQTDSQGKFSLNVDFGKTYSFSVSAPGYRFFQSEMSGTMYGDTERLIVGKR